MGFDREPEESFDYLNAVKNGSPAEIARQVERAERIRKEKWDNLKAELNPGRNRRSQKFNRWRKRRTSSSLFPKRSSRRKIWNS